MAQQNPDAAKTDEQVGDEHTTYSSILQEYDVSAGQQAHRRKKLTELSSPKLNNDKKAATIGHISHDALDSSDIPILGSMLLKVGDVHTLNLILHSPGGDGTVVETFVSLCRIHCKRFRVVIPTMAKSAATMISLGADVIVMGPSSEIGPIDAQIPIQVSGVRRYASAQSFIDARDTLLRQHAEALEKKQDVSALLQMIASLDLPFIVECERLMDFGRVVGKDLLKAHMFARDTDADAKADKVVSQLSSVALHKVHGRAINGQDARTKLGLKVQLCGNDDSLWKLAWEWYTRAEIFMNRAKAVKLFETKDETLLGQ